MQQLDLITSLPSRLSCIILLGWLKLKSVIALDSAYCSRSHRSEFLGLLESDEYYICEEISVSRGLDVEKVFQRFGEKIKIVEFDCVLISAEEDLVRSCSHNFAHVTFSSNDSCTQELWNLLKINPHIESLTVSSDTLGVLPFKHTWVDLELPNLESLSVSGYQIMDDIMNMTKLGTILELDLHACEIAENILLQIANQCPRLQTLDLSDMRTKPITDGTLGAFATSCPFIAELNIFASRGITDIGILNVVQKLKGLQDLNIVDVDHLTDASLVHIYTHCANTLHTISFSYESSKGLTFSASAINTLLERCTHLRTVNLLDYGSSDTPPFIFSAQAISNLTSLYITGNIGSDYNLVAIGLYGVKIKELTIDRCYDCEHTHATLSSIVNGCPSLKRLYYKLQNEYIPTTPDFLTPEYWMKIRPNLQVTLVNDHDHDSDSE